MNNILENRTYKIDGNWYAPENHLKSFSSVVKVELCDTTSSAGDWAGYLIQKIGKVSYFIPFNQVNNYPRMGFTLYTGKPIAYWQGKLSQESIYGLWNDLIEFGLF
jgi:hypothetical protein